MAPNSPDLNPLDYYFWDAVNIRMKKLDPNTTTIQEFIEKIKRAVFSVPIKKSKKH